MAKDRPDQESRTSVNADPETASVPRGICALAAENRQDRHIAARLVCRSGSMENASGILAFKAIRDNISSCAVFLSAKTSDSSEEP